MNGPASRLRQLAEQAGYETLAEFARAAGVQDGTMRQHIARDSISKDAAELYVRKAKKTGATVEWLLYGKGTGPKGSPTEDRPAAARPKGRTEGGEVVVPELDVHAMAGQGADGSFELMEETAADDIIGQYSFPAPGFRQVFGANAGEVVIGEVRGDSMLPTLVPGQKVMVNLGDKSPTPPGLFYVWDGLGLVIKRVELIPGSNPATVRISSDNPRYQTYERTVEEAFINGRIIMGFTRY